MNIWLLLNEFTTSPPLPTPFATSQFLVLFRMIWCESVPPHNKAFHLIVTAWATWSHVSLFSVATLCIHRRFHNQHILSRPSCYRTPIWRNRRKDFNVGNNFIIKQTTYPDNHIIVVPLSWPASRFTHCCGT